MDLNLVLTRLGLSGQDWGPDTSSYAALAAGWRGDPELLPSEAEVNAEWAEIVSEGGVATTETAELRAIAGNLVDLAKAPAGKVARGIVKAAMKDNNILRRQVIGVVSATWNPASMANGTGVTSPGVTVPGAVFGDFIAVAAPYDLQGIVATGYVSAPDTVKVRLSNSTGAPVDLASGSWKVAVWRPEEMAPRTFTQAKNAVLDEIVAGGDVD